MSYGKRVATFDQFQLILRESAEKGFENAPKPEQISGLMEGVTVILSIEEMSADYLKHIASGAPYTPHHRVRATILFDYGTYLVDVLDETLFALPTLDEWQASLPVITLPAEVIDEIMAEEDAEKAASERKATLERIRSGFPEGALEGADAVAEIRAMRDEDNKITFGEEDAPEYLDGKDDKPEDGGSGVTAPVPDPEPAPTTSAAKEPAKRPARRRQPKSLGAGKGAPADLSTREGFEGLGEPVPSETPVG
jgi:hypothetical protein